LGKIETRGIIVSARGNDVDFVSRFFGPQVGINEDPATGSSHTALTPYWANELRKNRTHRTTAFAAGRILQMQTIRRPCGDRRPSTIVSER